MTELDPKKTILRLYKPGDYMGREGQQKLNAIVTLIHKEIMSSCMKFSQRNLIENFYRLLDYSCLVSLDGTHWIGKEAIAKALFKAPAISRYLVEASLLYGGMAGDKTLDDEAIAKFYSAAQMLVENCNSSDAMF